MLKTSTLALIVTAMLASWSPPASAWGHQGHETVGALAALMIEGSNAEKQIQTILQPNESLDMAAEWADCAKGRAYCNAEPTPEMKAFVARNPQDKSYHYSDIPFQMKAYPAGGSVGVSPDDVVHILQDAILILQGKPASNPNHKLTQREALFLVAHMTGDIHQPLHVGAAYIAEGNLMKAPASQEAAKAAFTEGGNLLCMGSRNVHSLWDDDFVVGAMKDAQVSTPQDFAKKLLGKAKQFAGDKGAVGTWPEQWATESLRLSADVLSNIQVHGKRAAGPGQDACGKSDPQSKGSVWDVQLPSSYELNAKGTVPNQLAIAGARLAKTLTAIWP